MDRIDFLARHFIEQDGRHPQLMLGKHKKMTQSPFVFFRGSAPLFYADIQSGVLPLPEQASSLPLVYVMGDCHASNFGFFSEEGSHSGSIIFAPNDFDDACVGNALWDLVRYCVSLYLVRAHCEVSPLALNKPIVSEYAVSQAVSHFLTTYMQECEAMASDHQRMYSAIETITGDGKLNKLWQKAERRSVGGSDFHTKSTLAKATQVSDDGSLKFVANQDKFSPLDDKTYSALAEVFSPYMDDAVHDIVKRLNAGTGSVNLERYYMLVGPTRTTSQLSLGEYHIVEIKQQRVASPLRYLDNSHPANRLNPAHLTARCQRHMQRNPDLLLDEVVWRDAHWLVRSRHHAKVGINPEDIAIGKKNVSAGFVQFVELCAKSLALAHCRSERRGMTYETAVIQRASELLPAIADIAADYAEQVRHDYSLFCRLGG